MGSALDPRWGRSPFYTTSVDSIGYMVRREGPTPVNGFTGQVVSNMGLQWQRRVVVYLAVLCVCVLCRNICV